MSRVKSIMSEFDDPTETPIVERQAEAPANIFLRIARLYVQEQPTDALCSIFGITEASLQALMKTPEFNEALAVARKEAHERTYDIDRRWDEIEDQALRVAQETIEFLDSERAMSTALMANRAKRRTRELPAHAISDQSAGNSVNNVTLNVSNVYIEKLAGLNPTEELARVVEANKHKKIIDLAQPRRIDELLAREVQSEQLDNDIMDTLRDKV